MLFRLEIMWYRSNKAHFIYSSIGHFDRSMAKLVILENNRLTIEGQKNAIENFYNLLLTKFRHAIYKFTGIYSVIVDVSLRAAF